MNRQFKKYLDYLCLFIISGMILVGFGQDPISARSISSLPYPPQIVKDANSANKISNLERGKNIDLNNLSLSAPWIQWQEANSRHTGIADTSAMTILGLELLKTDDPDLQPALWYSESPSQPILLKVKQLGAYRYLDISDLLAKLDWQVQTLGNTLRIDSPVANIKNVSNRLENSGEQIILDLDRPVAWQVSQNSKQGIVTIAAIADASWNTPQYSPLPPILPELDPEERQKLTSGNDKWQDEIEVKKEPISTPKRQNPLYSLETSQFSTQLSFNLQPGKRLEVSTLANPNRLKIDVRSNSFTERDIAWKPGIHWHQKLIPVASTSLNSLFPEDKNRNAFVVTWLDIDLHSKNISLKPITSYNHSMTGTSPLIAIASLQDASAAINGGFFNRNNKLPLGAIRRDNLWLSGPILNRAAIAWNDRGDIKIDRLSLNEILTTSTGKNLSISLLNSGYVAKGIARYSQAWGTSYTPLTNNEKIVLVENDRVSQQIDAGMAGKNSFTIPREGYLLTVRGQDLPGQILKVGTKLRLDSTTIPNDFFNYPHILGAGPLLLKNRQIVLDAAAEQFSTAFEQQSASRSAIGTNTQGKLILVAVHRRLGGGAPTLADLARILQNLGVVNALNLDGGSSTSLYLGGQSIDRSASTAARVHNGIGIFWN